MRVLYKGDLSKRILALSYRFVGGDPCSRGDHVDLYLHSIQHHSLAPSLNSNDPSGGFGDVFGCLIDVLSLEVDL